MRLKRNDLREISETGIDLDELKLLGSLEYPEHEQEYIHSRTDTISQSTSTCPFKERISKHLLAKHYLARPIITGCM